MCGIAGFVGVDHRDPEGLLRSMVSAVAHRGPDERGHVVAGPAALGMARLSVVDLTGGKQPKSAADGAIQVVFNGEIYNHHELRHQLEAAGHRFESSSDSEVVARAIEEWGSEAFDRFTGMFAIASWDARNGRLTLARDRIGEKPLYLWPAGASLAFASELKAFAPLRPWPAIDRRAFGEYLHLGYVPHPGSIWEGITKLAPGHLAEFDRGALSTRAYWQPRWGATVSDDPVDELDRRLRNSVAGQLEADVEVGVLLSGGIDSTLVAMAAADQHPRIRTFTVGFDDPALDESDHARAVATALGTTHHETRVTGAEALDVVHELADVYDEPFADSSAVPTLLVCRFARHHLKVVLGGDGGDELFSGYGRYSSYQRVTRLQRLMPPAVWRALAPLARSGQPFLSRAGNVADRMAGEPAVTYRNVVSILNPGLLEAVLSHRPELAATADSFRSCFAVEGHLGPRLADLCHYLPGDILVKVDRASMSTGLEVRAPFLDHGMVEWAMGLSPGVIGPPGAKVVPRALMARRFRQLSERPKQGFGVPLERWLLGPLRPLLDDRLSPSALRSHGLVDPAAVRLLISRMEAGRRAVASPLWALLMFQLWHDRWVGSP